MNTRISLDTLPDNVPDLSVGYVVNTYPRPSQTFIRREIQALEGLGVAVTRFAMRRDAQPVTSDEDRAEEVATTYILEDGAVRLATALIRACLSRPRALLAALRAGRRGGEGRGALRHLIYLAEAAVLARRCQDLGLRHLHAHFGTNSVDVVRYVHMLGGPGYSFTVHGPEEFDATHALSLDDKITEARFAVAVSTFGRSQLARWTPFAQWDRLQVVHCGIDPDRFAVPFPMPAGPGPNLPLRLVSIGRFAEQKGQMLLIEAMARCSAPVHLTLVGDGPLAPALRAAIAQHRLTDRIDLPGWKDEAGVRAALAEAHVMVLPSFAEGLPVALMEAMAAGRPSITTYIAGIPELMIDGHTGWLVPAGDADALAQALDHAAATPPAALGQMGLAARERVLARHDIRAEAAKLAALFHAYQHH
ncbi:glycosyltransferase [Paracoccus sp. (in: a-proteobacteria)]|uniref:glycosyltransferase n=1 Tax=Paracoccus sp. TaxID=267 RepID=UPI00396C587D